MNDVITTLNLLTEGLDKKKAKLVEIFDYTKAQEELLKEEDFDLKSFNNIIKNKQFRIDTVIQIDDGFQPTYERVQAFLEKNPEIYRTYIESMKSSIREISELGIQIQVLEEKNYNRFKVVSSLLKEEVKAFRTNKKAVTNYYETYNKQQGTLRDNFFDSKK
jgi:hypothetical protein